jgi:hypothetical protein
MLVGILFGYSSLGSLCLCFVCGNSSYFGGLCLCLFYVCTVFTFLANSFLPMSRGLACCINPQPGGPGQDKIRNTVIKQKMNVERSLLDDIKTKQL